MSAEAKREAGRKNARSVTLQKRSTVMKDGRNMYFYTFESTVEKGEQQADSSDASAQVETPSNNV